MSGYKYYRLYITKFFRGSTEQPYADLAGLCLYDANNVDVAQESGCVYSASTTQEGTPANCFDGDPSTYWCSNWTSAIPAWVKVELPTAKAITHYSICPRDTSTTSGQQDHPVDFVLQGSNDDSTWETIDGRAGLQSGWASNVYQSFSFEKRRVSFIQSTGTQYIDTGIRENLVYEVEMDFMPTSLSYLYQSYLSGTRDDFTVGAAGQITQTYLRYKTVEVMSHSSYSDRINTLVIKNNKVVFNGSDISTVDTSAPVSTSNSSNIFIFCDHTRGGNNEKSTMRLYRLKLYGANGVLLRDFIPIIDSNDAVCLYDKISKVYFYNESGNGVFTSEEITELDYIESNGTQYINTGFKATDIGKVVLDCSIESTPSQWDCAFGSQGDYSGGSKSLILTWNNSCLNFRCGSGSNQIGMLSALTLHRRYLFECDNSVEFSVDGVSQGTATAGTLSSTLDFYIFANNSEGTTRQFVSMRLYACEIYDTSNNLIANYIPYFDGESACLYDSVSDSLLYNAGSGDFVAGYKPTIIEYIQSTGTQYIDTGIVPTANTKFVLEVSDVQQDSGERAIFGCGSYSSDTYLLTKDAGTHYLTWYYPAKQTVSTDCTSKHKIELYRGSITVDGAVVSSGTTISGTSFSSLTLFNVAGTYNSKYKLYSFKVYENDVLTADFVPAIDANNVVCLYDTIAKRCFYNAGSGNFIAGGYHKYHIQTLSTSGGDAVIQVDTYVNDILIDSVEMHHGTAMGTWRVFDDLIKIGYATVTQLQWTVQIIGSTIDGHAAGENISWSYTYTQDLILQESAPVDTGLGWSAKSGYLVSELNELIATISGREFRKTVAGYAVAVSVRPSTTGYSGPIILSTVQDYAKYTAYNIVNNTVYACHYAGQDWYMSELGLWMYGNDIPNTAGKAPYWSMTGYTSDQIEAIALDILQEAGVASVASPIKYLIESGGDYYTIVNSTLTNVGSTLNAQVFTDYGMTTLPDFSSYSSLTNPTLLKWCADEEVDVMIAYLTGHPALPQTVVSEAISLTHPDITGIEDVEISCEGTPVFAVSVDGGTTWKMWDANDNRWETLSNITTGMTASVMEDVSTSAWSDLISGASTIKIRFTLIAVSDKVTNVIVNFTH